MTEYVTFIVLEYILLVQLYVNDNCLCSLPLFAMFSTDNGLPIQVIGVCK